MSTLVDMSKYIPVVESYARFFFKFLTLTTVFLIKLIGHLCSFVLQVLNIIPNFQWKKDLNILQNLVYNMYVPSSQGIPSMHSSLLTFSIMAIALTFMSEIYRFYINPEYQFSIGFYTTIGALSGLIITAFSWKSYTGKKNGAGDAPTVQNSSSVHQEEEVTQEDIPSVDQPAAPPISISNSSESESGEHPAPAKKKTKRSKKSLNL